jgi:predicted DCC family thiol-disulfide oxidoreductase YuxK
MRAVARNQGMTQENALTVYYDGACPLCSAEISFYEGRRGAEAIRFVDVAAENAATGPDLTCREALQRFHVRRSDGTLLSGARAFVAIWEALPGWRRAARFAHLPGVLPLMEAGYRAFLPARPLLSRMARRFGARPRTNG